MTGVFLMARLFEYECKQLLKSAGIDVPPGEPARSPGEARSVTARLGVPVMVKAQVWETERARRGGVVSAEGPEEAEVAAASILGEFGCGCVLVEARIKAMRQLFVGITIDDRLRRPVVLVSSRGGSGIEQRAASVVRLPLDVTKDLPVAACAALAQEVQAPEAFETFLSHFWAFARKWEARSIEVNPLAITSGQRLIALDCRLSIDDYAIYRHPELGIDIARESASPATVLDKIAWQAEKDDYRGTFFFIETDRESTADGEPIGFHGCGGGGAMAALDAARRAGLRAVDFCDTSGSPPASKVYRAAKIILSLPGIRGYFLCGSGVASQEQFHLARALVKAFREDGLDVPAVLRLGGNGEEFAREVVDRFSRSSRFPVEAYQKSDSADWCAQRLRRLIEDNDPAPHVPSLSAPVQPTPRQPYTFETRTGSITYDHAICVQCETKACVKECVPQILETKNGVPVLNISREEARRGRCIECLACEVECWYQGIGGAAITLPIAGLEEYRKHSGHTD
jgi:succinyl-CoA synthetase beta subunit